MGLMGLRLPAGRRSLCYFRSLRPTFGLRPTLDFRGDAATFGLKAYVGL